MRAQSEIEQLLRKRVADNPSDTWLYFKDEEYSWAAVLSFARRAANGLLALGVRPGERVGIMASNRPDFLWAYFGCLLIGCHVVPINRWQRGPALEHMINDSAVRALICDSELVPIISELRPRTPMLSWLVVLAGPRPEGAEAAFADLLLSPDREPDVEVKEQVEAVGLLYTSGTTGPPKGILARAFERHLWPLLEPFDIKPGEVIYTCMPLFHASALLVFGTASIRRNAKLALGEAFSASGFWDECRRYNAVCANVFGVMIPYLLKQAPLPNDRENPLRGVLSVGCPASAWKEFEDRFDVRIVEFYGATDAPGFVMNTDGKAGSVGKPVDGAEYRIVDENDNEVPPGTAGEIVYRHPTGRLTAYNNLPDVTEKTWRGGWYHSGDLGEMDEQGFFYFRGRVKEAIRRRGENISAWEVSSVIDLHPKVQESAAFGVPSELGEEEVMVSVVPRPGVDDLRPEEILEFCRGRLAYFALPRFVDILPELPKTSTQKIQHLALKARGRSERTWDRDKAGYVISRS